MASPDEDVVQQKVFVKGHQVYSTALTHTNSWMLLLNGAVGHHRFELSGCLCRTAHYHTALAVAGSGIRC
jgi:hypothetical protein